MPKKERKHPSTEEALSGLAQVDLFSGLDECSLRSLLPLVHVRVVDTDHSLCKFNDKSNDVFIILEGLARATVFSPNGREVAFRDLESGESFGELAAIDGQPRSSNVIIQRPSVVGTLLAANFMKIIHKHPVVAVNTLKKLTRWVRGLSERVYEFNAPVPVRVCSEISRMSKEKMISDDIARLSPAPKHAEIAARVNTHREAVSRTMAELQRMGILKRGRGELIVTSLVALENHIGSLEDDG